MQIYRSAFICLVLGTGTWFLDDLAAKSKNISFLKRKRQCRYLFSKCRDLFLPQLLHALSLPTNRVPNICSYKKMPPTSTALLQEKNKDYFLTDLSFLYSHSGFVYSVLRAPLGQPRSIVDQCATSLGTLTACQIAKSDHIKLLCHELMRNDTAIHSFVLSPLTL